MKRLALTTLLSFAAGILVAQPLSWPDWGPIVNALPEEITWTTDDDQTIYGAFATTGDAPISVLSVAPDGTASVAQVPLVLASGQTLLRSAYVPASATGAPVIAAHVSTREGARLYLHSLPSDASAEAARITVGGRDSVEVPLPDLGPRSWLLSRDPTGGVELLFARNSDDGAEIGTLRFDGDLRPSPVNVLHSQELTITDLAQTAAGRVIAWRSTPHARSRVTVALRRANSLELLGEVRGGLDVTGASPGSKTRLGLAANEAQIAVVFSYIERERTPLSNYWTGVRFALFDRPRGVGRASQPEAGRDTVTPRVVDLVPASDGALYSSYDLAFVGSTLAVGFLYELRGSSDFYVADLSLGSAGVGEEAAPSDTPAPGETAAPSDNAGAGETAPATDTPGADETAPPSDTAAAAVNVSQSPRRVAAPWLGVHEGRLRYLWLQGQPGGYTPIQAYREESWLRERLPLILEGLLAETVVSALLSIPIAVVVGIFYALIGSAPALALAYFVLALVQRMRPELMRQNGTWVTSLVFAFTLLSIGLPPLSYAPLPSTLLPPLFVGLVALILIARWYGRRSERALPTAAQIAGVIALGMVAVVATGSYEFVVEALRDPGWLPPTLGG